MSLNHKTFRQRHGKFLRKRLLRMRVQKRVLRVTEEEITDGAINT